HNVIPGATVVLDAGTSTTHTFLGWFRADNLPAATATLTPPPGTTHTIASMPDAALHYVAVWGNQRGTPFVPNDNVLTLSNNPTAASPSSQTITVDSTARTEVTIGDHNVIPNAVVVLNAGTSATHTFLGWFRADNVPAATDVITPPGDATHTFNMLDEAMHYVAVWGNQRGNPFVPNDIGLTISNNPTAANPADQSIMVTGTLRTEPVVGTHNVIPGATVVLDAGTSTTHTFLGWFRNDNLPLPGVAITVPTASTRTFDMPEGATHYVAVWGNHRGIPYVPNEVDLTVIVYSSNGNRIPTASLLHDGDAVTRNTDLTFSITGTAGDTLIASAYGFRSTTHVIVPNDLVGNRTIIITLGDEERGPLPTNPGNGDEYETVTLTVEVRQLAVDGGALIPHAGLTIAPARTPAAVITPVTGTLGAFTVEIDGRHVEDILTAAALGFVSNTHDIWYTDLAPDRGTIIIRLAIAPPEAITVRVESSNGNLIPTASLLHEGAAVTRNANHTFTIMADGSNLGDMLEASAPGFTNNTHEIVSSDLGAPRIITIILGDENRGPDPTEPGEGDRYQPVTLYVEVQRASGTNPLIPHAILTIDPDRTPAAVITAIEDANGTTGRFTIVVDGRHVEDILEAAATGFDSNTHELTYFDLDLARDENTPIVIRLTAQAATPVTVYVYSSNGNRVPTAEVTHPELNVTNEGDGAFTIYLNGDNIGDVLTATAPGFTDTTRTIVHEDLAGNRTIIITLGDEGRDPYDPTEPGEGDRYQPVTFTVEVRQLDADGGELIPGANLGIAPNRNPAAVIIPIDGTLGAFTVTVDGRHVGDILEASAIGFDSNTHTIAYVDLYGDDTVIIIRLAAAPIDVTVRVYSSNGNLLPTASLDYAGTTITRNEDGTFTISVSGNNIGDILEASAPGFTNTTHTIVEADIVNGEIIIILGDPGRDLYIPEDPEEPTDPGDDDYYDTVTLTVEVRRLHGSTLITNAALSIAPINRDPSAIITPIEDEPGTFTVEVDGRHVGDILTAAAPGFHSNTHAITYIDLYEELIVIILTAVPSGGGDGPVRPPVTVITEPELPLAEIFSPYHNAFLVGVPDGRMMPHANITRAEVATILFRLLSDDFRASVWSQQNSFSDVNANAWFNNAVSTMTNAGILTENPGGTFRPNDAVTRAEFAAMVARFFSEFSATNNAFSDIEGNWAENYINLVAQFGWVQGAGDGTFNPNALMTRAEAAAIVNRMLERILEGSDGLLDGRTRFPDVRNENAWYYLYIQEATHSTLFERNSNGRVSWTAILPHLDWTVLERPHSTPRAIAAARQIQMETVADDNA
ncbi:MAG: S-layer homology domain-containing protein, partial [Oscillospiraceae bacterium]|nr:S-layer homology domain-containing protein [Oscillospiraceae bacterium]